MQLGICPCCTTVVRRCHEQGQVIRGRISLSKLRAFLSSTSESIQTPMQLLRQLKPCETSPAKYPRHVLLIVSARNEERDNATAQYTTVNIPVRTVSIYKRTFSALAKAEKGDDVVEQKTPSRASFGRKPIAGSVPPRPQRSASLCIPVLTAPPQPSRCVITADDRKTTCHAP